ncbi:MAG: phospholipid carrier-dependent glycosyltransferase [Candidatus Amesbacteria bacterium]|nr:phospholipid carrier-dependent glycosyltransferase [Candidatus Amesbacteria bacterium]
MLGLIIAFTLITRLWNLHLPTEYYFDEVYNAFTTQEIVKNNIKAYEWFHTSPVVGTAYGWTHPPLAKLISAIGILLFGDNSFGWRVSGAVLGTGVIYLTYLIAKEFMTKKWALLAALFASLDGLILVQSRINMNDIYALFFILLVFYFFVKKRLLLLAISLGMLLATKWTGLYAIAIFGWRKNIIGVLIVVLGIYLLSYSHYFYLGGTWQNFIELQKQMWWYNTNLTATHTYQSSWWTWPFNLRSVWYYVNYQIDQIANIYALGNPIIFWAGIPAVIYALFKRQWLIVIGYLAFWLPWARAPRIMFLYHYLPSVPFICMAIAYSLSQIKNKYLTIGICGLVIVAFVYFYPLWTGIPMPKEFVNQYFWLPGWK